MWSNNKKRYMYNVKATQRPFRPRLRRAYKQHHQHQTNGQHNRTTKGAMMSSDEDEQWGDEQWGDEQWGDEQWGDEQWGDEQPGDERGQGVARNLPHWLYALNCMIPFYYSLTDWTIKRFFWCFLLLDSSFVMLLTTFFLLDSCFWHLWVFFYCFLDAYRFLLFAYFALNHFRTTWNSFFYIL